MERVEHTTARPPARTDRHVVVSLRAGDVADLADVLVAADLAARLGARLVMIATMERWARWARWTAGVYCAFGVETVMCAARIAEQEAHDDFEGRLRSLLDLVGVEWTLEWSAGSPRRAAVRYTRRFPDTTVILRPERHR